MVLCRVCHDPRRAAIEADMREGTLSWKSLRQSYGIHHLVLIRHKRIHMKPAAYRKISTPRAKKHVTPLHEPTEQGVVPAAYDEISMPRVTQKSDTDCEPRETTGKPSPYDEISMPRVSDHGDDPIRVFRYHVKEAAQVWRAHRTDQGRHQSMLDILQQAFQEPDMGL